MRKAGITMRLIIAISSMVLMIATFSIIAYFVFSSWRASIDNIVISAENDSSEDIVNKVESVINKPLEVIQSNQNLFEKNILNLQDKREREVYFTGILLSNSIQLYSFSYGTEKGEYYGARRNPKGDIEIMENNAETGGKTRYYSVTDDYTAGKLVEETGLFDARTRDWYMIAKEKKKTSFSTVYKHFVMNDLAISAACPVYDKAGVLKGVIGAHIILSTINQQLEEVAKQSKATAYIVERSSGELIANSLKRPNFDIAADNTVKRFNIDEIDNKAIQEAYHTFLDKSQNRLTVTTPEDKLHITVTEYKKEGLDWLVITSIPESQFTAGVNKSIKFSILVSIIAILIAIIIYFKITDIIFKPIKNLINTTEKFSKGDFSERVKVYRNDEIGKLSNAFNDMAKQLDILINDLENKVAERTSELEIRNIKLKESEGDIHLLLDSTAEAIYGIDLDGNCTFLNASCLSMLGYSNQSEVIGKNTHGLIHHKHWDGTIFPLEECQVFNAISKGECTHAEDEVFWRADGSFFPVEYFSYPQYRDGQIIGAVVTFFDITERLIAQNELIRAKEQAEDANRSKSLFLASMSHEIRTPINGIVGFLQLLENAGLNIKQQKLVHSMKISINAMLSIINDILDISKIEAGKLELERIPFDLRKIIDNAVVSYSAAAIEKGIKLDKVVNPEIPQYVMGDPTKLRQIINNLISNAVKFTNEGSVLVKAGLTRKTETYAEINFTVADTGIGMTAVESERIFQPFTQADSSLTRKYGGTGLGLSICKSYIEKMNGKIEVTSEVNKGSTFSFSIRFAIPSEPDMSKINDFRILDDDTYMLAGDESDDIEEAMFQINKENNSNIKILLVEDNKTNRVLFTKLLKTKGYSCDVALNGEEAVRACENKAYDIIFMDCQMPVMDGYEATKQIRMAEDKNHTFIVAMTAYAMKGDAEKCIAAGMDAYISKPVSVEQVVKLIKELAKSKPSEKAMTDVKDCRDLFSTVIHDIRSPMANMVSMMEVLEEEACTSENFEIIQEVKKQVNTTYIKIESLLEKLND